MIAQKLAEAGAAVSVWDLRPEGAEATAALIRQASGQAIACGGDASKAADITAAVVFLASEDADSVTGHILSVNGGRNCN